jgi:hypothetical protein
MWTGEGGGRQVTAADTGTRGRSRPGELHRRRILLLAESAGLAAVLHHLLGPGDRLARVGSLRELADTRALDSADVVVLDLPAEDRAGAVAQVRRRYLGPLVVLADRGENVGGLRLDDAATLLARPFSAEDLGAALAIPGGAVPAGLWMPEPTASRDRLRSPTGGADPWPDGSGTPAEGAVTEGAVTDGTPAEGPAADGGAAAASVRAAELKAAARQAPVRRAPAIPSGRAGLVERGQRLLIGLTEGWKARRRVRVAGFSVFALVAFTVAFALAAQGRCGPGCDALGTGFLPKPTVAGNQSSVPSTSAPKRPTSTTAPPGSPATGAFRGISGGRVAATTTTQRATTTTGKAVGTTRPATTRPATTKTTAPPTTAPATTAPPTTAPPNTTAGA